MRLKDGQFREIKKSKKATKFSYINDLGSTVEDESNLNEYNILNLEI
jgi:hypothetical protein